MLITLFNIFLALPLLSIKIQEMYYVQNIHCLSCHRILLPSLLDERFGLVNESWVEVKSCSEMQLWETLLWAVGSPTEEGMGQTLGIHRQCGSCASQTGLSPVIHKSLSCKELSHWEFAYNKILQSLSEKKNIFLPFYFCKCFKFNGHCSLQTQKVGTIQLKHWSLCAMLRGNWSII